MLYNYYFVDKQTVLLEDGQVNSLPNGASIYFKIDKECRGAYIFLGDYDDDSPSDKAWYFSYNELEDLVKIVNLIKDNAK